MDGWEPSRWGPAGGVSWFPHSHDQVASLFHIRLRMDSSSMASVIAALSGRSLRVPGSPKLSLPQPPPRATAAEDGGLKKPEVPTSPPSFSSPKPARLRQSSFSSACLKSWSWADKTPLPRSWKASAVTDRLYLGRGCRCQLCPSDSIGLTEASV